MDGKKLREKLRANFYDQRDKAREEEAEYLRMKNNRELRRARERFLKKQKAKTKKVCRP